MDFPVYIQTAMQILKDHGAEGYAVGGCVRDTLLGRPVNDYDLAVNVPPQETERCFAGYKVIETGLKHGTVTVVIDKQNVEITSFRIDGGYTDARRPDSVAFTPSLEQDLCRRDFTVNAMACGQNGDIIDLFGGKEDLQSRLIRCVGDPDARFKEDALRILRALRFAAVLGFSIEEKTAAALRNNAPALTKISAERKFAELKKLLAGAAAEPILTEYRDVICVCIPQLADLPEEEYSAAARAAGQLRDALLSFAALMRPLGPQTADEVCRDLKTDNRFRAAAVFLIENLHAAYAAKGQARRALGAFGADRCRMLLRFRQTLGIPADALNDVIADPGDLPAKIADLRVTGAEIAALGFTGKEIAQELNRLLIRAAEGDLPNEKEPLLQAAAADKNRDFHGDAGEVKL